MEALKFTPILKETVWGGEKICRYKTAVATNCEAYPAHIGESWELSGVNGNESVVCEGSLSGKTIRELISQYKGELVGESVYQKYGDEFPLLVKFIDAVTDLSIQVHPDDDLASRRHNGSKGKTEMWYVIDAEPGAFLYAGFEKEISPEEYEKSVEEGSITERLARHPVQKGDVFFLPAGRVHAICGGCFIAEIQQTSDITYRIYDYGRLGLDGKPRQLHTDEAKQAIDFQVYPEYRTRYVPELNQEVELVSCPYFTTSLLEVDCPYQKDLSNFDCFLIVICLAGKGQLQTETGSVNVAQGDTVLIPASTQHLNFVPSESSLAKFLLSHNL